MLTYENFVAILLGSIERAGLNVGYTQELLDTHALGRSLSITCLPDGFKDDQGPQEPPLRATIAFRWSPEFTVFSLRGGDSLDNIERMVDERLSQAQEGPSLAVEVIYSIPLSPEQQRDISLLPNLARTIQDLQAALNGVDRQIRIDAQLAFVAGRIPRMQALTGSRVWSLDEALYDSELLTDTFDELCAELRGMLEALSMHYSVGENNASDHDDDEDLLSGDRRYLKPPTA